MENEKNIYRVMGNFLKKVEEFEKNRDEAKKAIEDFMEVWAEKTNGVKEWRIFCDEDGYIYCHEFQLKLGSKKIYDGDGDEMEYVDICIFIDEFIEHIGYLCGKIDKKIVERKQGIERLKQMKSELL